MTEKKNNRLQIRNSTVDFLMFTKGAHEDGIEVRVQGRRMAYAKGNRQSLCRK